MRLTLHLLGLEVFNIEATTDTEPESDVKAYGAVECTITAQPGDPPVREGWGDGEGKAAGFERAKTQQS